MTTLRARLRLFALVWLVCQLLRVSAVLAATTCGEAPSNAEPAGAACPMHHGDHGSAQACQCHHAAPAAQHCRCTMREVPAGSPIHATFDLLWSGVLPALAPGLTPPLVARHALLITPSARSALAPPDAPPPRA